MTRDTTSEAVERVMRVFQAFLAGKPLARNAVEHAVRRALLEARIDEHRPAGCAICRVCERARVLEAELKALA